MFFLQIGEEIGTSVFAVQGIDGGDPHWLQDDSALLKLDAELGSTP